MRTGPDEIIEAFRSHQVSKENWEPWSKLVPQFSEEEKQYLGTGLLALISSGRLWNWDFFAIHLLEFIDTPEVNQALFRILMSDRDFHIRSSAARSLGLKKHRKFYRQSAEAFLHSKRSIRDNEAFAIMLSFYGKKGLDLVIDAWLAERVTGRVATEQVPRSITSKDNLWPIFFTTTCKERLRFWVMALNRAQSNKNEAFFTSNEELVRIKDHLDEIGLEEDYHTKKLLRPLSSPKN